MDTAYFVSNSNRSLNPKSLPRRRHDDVELFHDLQQLSAHVARRG